MPIFCSGLTLQFFIMDKNRRAKDKIFTITVAKKIKYKTYHRVF